jgi:hypothetical protein
MGKDRRRADGECRTGGATRKGSMFRSDQPTNYEAVYQGLVDRLSQADFGHAAAHLGGRPAGRGVALDVFGRTLRVEPNGVSAEDGGPIDFTVRIVLAYYLLHAGQGDLEGEWVSYRDFKDGAFFHASFTQIVENKIARDFTSRRAALEAAAGSLAGRPLEAGLGGDLCCFFPALPRTPMALIFYDRDEDFPASARVLFDASAPRFLDLECLAVLGLILCDRLAAADTAKTPPLRP